MKWFRFQIEFFWKAFDSFFASKVCNLMDKCNSNQKATQFTYFNCSSFLSTFWLGVNILFLHFLGLLSFWLHAVYVWEYFNVSDLYLKPAHFLLMSNNFLSRRSLPWKILPHFRMNIILGAKCIIHFRFLKNFVQFHNHHTIRGKLEDLHPPHNGDWWVI